MIVGNNQLNSPVALAKDGLVNTINVKKDVGAVQTLEKLHTIIQAVETVKKGATSRGYCATYTLLSGLFKVATGNWFSGAVATGAGAVELYKIFGNHQTNDLKRLLEDTGAGLEMLQALDQENKKSLISLESDLQKVQAGINELTNKLSQVEGIATFGRVELEQLKEEAKVEYTKAIAIQQKVLEKLTSAKEKLSKGTEALAKSKESIRQLSAQADQTVRSSDVTKVLEQFQKVTEGAISQFSSAQKIIVEADEELSQAIGLLHDSNKQNERAITAATTAIATASEKFKAIKEIAKHEQQKEILQDKTKCMENEIKLMQKRVDEQEEIVRDAQQNIKDAQDVITFGMQSVIIGGGLGAFFGNMVGAPVIGAPVGVIAYHNWHNGGVISQATSAVTGKVRGAVYGAEIHKPAAPDASKELLKFTFDNTSSGWGGWMLGKRSATVGNLEISLGKEKINYRINLNSKMPLSITDMVDLRKRLMAAVSKNPALATEAESIVSGLKTLEIKRDERSTINGVVGSSTPYFGVDYQNLIARAKQQR